MWQVTLEENENAEPSLKEQEDFREAQARDAILGEPLVKEALERFPDSELISFTNDDERRSSHEVAR